MILELFFHQRHHGTGARPARLARPLDAVPDAAPRRAGDPASVVAAVDRIRDDVGWEARYGMPELLASAWAAWGAGRPQA